MLPQERGFYMSEKKTNRKPLLIGIIAAVVILIALLVVVLTQCTGGESTTESTPAQTVGYLGEAEDYDLYWNLDRALYDGKSEAGMSSRKPESDGYFHVRFFIDGEIVELKVADRKTVNAIEVNDLMGLEFNEDGIVVGVISLDDMPLQQVGWKFYVQSIGGNFLKLNSAKTFDGMELLLEMLSDTGIYDMTGAEGEVGKSIKPIATDRVIAIANLEGKLTHVFIYERSEYMQTFEAECRHCKQVVTWKKWNKTNVLPTAEEGHYQLQNDITLKTQMSIAEDAKICLDLNGFAVDGCENKRMYSLHNAGANLALMDTSEEQTGVMRGHGVANAQGGIVWVRYGAFYLYSGTLDASDLTTTISGTAVCVPKDTYFYMYGGTIIGGTSKYSYNAEKNSYGNGQSGSVAVQGKFVMNDGVITGGRAMSAITAWNNDGTPKTYQRGMGGNICVSSGGTFEMRGGTVKNGVANHSGGNIYLDGTAEMILDGGMITGGAVTGKGRNGGNVFVGSKATLEINGGSINWGTSYNCGGNLYFNGTVQMNGGYIGKGVIRTFGTGKIKADDNRSNVFQVNGKMYLYGGIIEGGYTITDTSATDKNTTTLVLSGLPIITPDKTSEYEGLVLTNGGGGVKVIVGTLVKGSNVGVNATTGIFTTPTAKANTAGFYSTIEGADIFYVDGCIALGRMSCVCGEEEHFGACDGTELLWAPINSSSIPATTGNYFLAKDVTITAQVAVAENADVKIDLNGKTLTGPNNKRALTTFNEGAKLTITDTSEEKLGVVKSRGTGDTQGNVVWVRYGSFDFYGGTLDGSGYTLHTNWAAGKDGVYGTKDDSTSGRDGGTVCVPGGTTFNMYGGTIIGNTAEAYVAEKTVKEGEGDNAVETVVTRNMTSPSGASLNVSGKAVFNMYAGTIRDGVSGNSAGNIYVNGGTMNMYGGTVSGGKAGPVYDEETGKIVTKGWSGNIDVGGSGAFNLHDGLITGGSSGGNGGNVRISHTNATFNMYGGVIEKGESLTDQGGNLFLSGTANLLGGTVRDGVASNGGGNIAVNSKKDVTLKGVTVTGGVAGGNGGNIRMSTTTTEGNLIIAEGTVISGGRAGKLGGNISLESNNSNKNDPIAKLIITGGTITGGRAGAYDEDGKMTVVDKTSTKKSTKTETATVEIDGQKVTVDVVVVTTETRTKALSYSGSGGNIYTGSNTVLEMTGGKVENGEAANGGNVYFGGTCEATLQGGTISGGLVGFYNEDGTMAKNTYEVLEQRHLKTAEEYKEGEADAAKLELQQKAAAVYVAPADKTSTKTENFSSGWGGNVYLYDGANVTISGATISGGKSGGNGGGVYIRGTKNVLTMTAGTLSGNTTAYDNGGNLWIGSGAVINIAGGNIVGGSAYNNGGNIHANANVDITLGNVAISGGSVRGKTNNKSANINLMAGKATIGSVNVAGYVHIASGSEVALVGTPVIKGGEINLTLNGDKLDVTALEGGEIGITSSTQGIISGKADAAKAAFFFSDHAKKSVVYVPSEEALGLGRVSCLCGKEEHLLGCNGDLLFWQAWDSTSALPVDSGNYYLTQDVTISGQTNIENAGAQIALDLHGYTVQNKEGKNTRLWRTVADDIHLTITDTVGGGTMKNNGTYTQGGLVWLSGKDGSLTIINGIFDTSDYLCNYPNGGAAITSEGNGNTFTLYGGTIYGPGALVDGSYGSGNGGAVLVSAASTMYLKGGHIEGGLSIHRQYSVKSNNEDGSITYNYGGGNGASIYVVGRLEMSGGTVNGGRACYGEAVKSTNKDGVDSWSKTGGHGGNIYLTGTMVMTGGTVSNGKGGLLDENDAYVHYIVGEDNARTSKGWGGNIEVTASGNLQIGGTAQIIGGETGGNGGNIYASGSGSVVTMTGGALVDGKTHNDNGGNLWIGSGTTLSVTGGSITGGYAYNNGGNIHSNANNTILLDNVTISGGQRRGDDKHVSANINLLASEVTFGSVNIAGYVNVASGSTVKLIGKPVIKAGATNLSLNGNDIDIAELDVGTDTYQVGITDASAGIFTGTAKEGQEKYFFSDDINLTVGFMNGKLTLGEGNLGLGRTTCSCAKPGGVCVGEAGGCDGQMHFWTAWKDGSNLPAQHGYWYLTKDVKTSGQFNMEKDATIHIDLNGFTVTDTANRTISTSDVAAIGSGNVKLWITDSSMNGTGAMILDYTSDKAYEGQGAIILLEAGSQLNLIAGTLDASKGSINHKSGGAAVCVARNTIFNMYGGTIIGGRANLGGAVSVVSNGTFNMYGGTITGGTATKGGSLYVLEGTANVYGGTIAGGQADEGGNIYIETDGKVNLLGGTVDGGKAVKTTGGNGGNIYVVGDLVVNGGTVENGKAGTLDTEGNVIFTVGGWGGNIVLGRIQDADDKSVYYTGSFEMLSGTIGKGESKGNGGSIYMTTDTVMNMSGGTLQNGISHADQGGNIFCSGNLTITGGEIKDGIGKNGGNIGINTTGAVTITGGTISGGKAGTYNASTGEVSLVGNGGNIRTNSNQNACNVTIGGTVEIKDGQAKNGGNLAVNRATAGKTATVTIEGGTISGGSATYGGNIQVGGEAVLNVTSGTISGGTAANGGNIYVAREQDKNDKTIYYYGAMTVSGGTITGGTVAKNGNDTGYGGNIYTNCDITISGGTISNGVAGKAATADEAAVQGWGGNLYVGSGKQITINGTASITGGWANNNGGSVHIGSGSVLMEGGSITGGYTNDRGGNIFVNANQTLIVTGGTISDGDANRAGNIAGNAGMKVELSNVTISDGVSRAATYAKRYNIEVTGGTNSSLTLGDGVVIDGGVEATGGTAVTISGKVIVEGDEYSLILNGNTITLGEMKADSRIGITNTKEGAFTKATEEAYLAYFFADDDAKGIDYIAQVTYNKSNGSANKDDKRLWLGHYDCECAGAGENGACVGAAGGCTESKLLWMPWETTNWLPVTTGNWYLTGNVTLAAQVKTITADQTIRLDLNGKTVSTSANRGIWMGSNNVKLIVTDSVGTGIIKNTATHDQGGIFWIATSGTEVKLLAGTMDASNFKNRGSNNAGGSAINVNGTNAKFVMYGGEIIANKDATEKMASAGAAVSVTSGSGTFELHGGKVNGGKVVYQPWNNGTNSGNYGGIGGAVFVTTGAKMIMTGGEIVGGTAVAANATETNAGGGLGGAIYLAGSLTMSGGKISGGSAVSALDSNNETVGGLGDNIYVTADGSITVTGGEIVGGVDATNAKAITVGGTAKIAGGASYNLNLGDKELTVNALSAGASIGITADEGAFTAAGRTEADLAYFTADNADQAISLYDGKLHLCKYACLCGSTTSEHKNYNDNGTIVGCDGTKVAWTPWTSTTTLPTTTGNFYLTGNVVLSGQASLVADSDVVLDLNGYKVTPAQDKGADKNMRMISIHSNGAKFTLTDTYIVPNASSADYDANRTGGEIVTSAKRVDTGNGVWARWDPNSFTKGTTFVMLGGKITGVDSSNTKNGTCVTVDANAKFYMLGGTITGGKTTGNGGNVYVAANGSMVMTGGLITAGNATRGANVYMNNGADFKMLGGTISAGHADNGGNLYVGGSTVKATFSMSGDAVISGGTVTGNGGNIYINNLSEATITSGTVTGGNAKNGGNININDDATLTVEGGQIINGTATTTTSAGVQVFGNLIVKGGKIGDSIQVLNWNRVSGASVTLSEAADLSQIKLSKGSNKDTVKVEDIEIPVITIEGTLATTVTENSVERTLDPINVITYSDLDAYISGTTVAANAARFTTSYAGRGVSFVESESKLYVGKYNCPCGMTTTTGDHALGCDKTLYFWEAWTKTDSMPTSGNWYLTKTVTVGSAQVVIAKNGTLRLDLNGQTVKDTTSRMMTTSTHNGSGNVKMLITDTSANKAGKLVLDYTGSYGGQGTILWLDTNSELTLLAGTFDASKMTHTDEKNGGGACIIVAANSTFNMYGGKLIGAKTAKLGGALGMTSGTTNIYGGEITGNTTDGSGVVYVQGGTLNIAETAGKTVEIDDIRFERVCAANSTAFSTPTVKLSGGPEIGSILFSARSLNANYGVDQLDALAQLTIEGKLTSTNPIAVSTLNGMDGYFAETTDADNAAKFVASEGKKVFFDADNQKLFIGMEHCLCGGNGNTDTTTGGTCVGATEGCDSVVRIWKPTASVPTETGNYYLTGDITEVNGKTITTSRDITIDLNGYNIIMKVGKGAKGAGRLYSTLGATADAEINFIFTNNSGKNGKFIIDDTNRDEGAGGDQGRVVWHNAGKVTVRAYDVDVDLSLACTKAGDFQSGIAFNAAGNGLISLYNMSITGGTKTNGPALAIGGSGKMYLHDVAVTGNTAGLFVNTGNAASLLTLSGTTYISGNNNQDLVLISGAKSVVLSNYTGTAGKTTGLLCATYDSATKSLVANTITADAPKVVAEATYAQKQLFTSNNTNVLALMDGKLQLVAPGSHVHCVCAGTLGNAANGYVYDLPGTDDDHVCEDVIYTAVSGDVTGGGHAEDFNWYLEDNVNIVKSGNNGHFQLTGANVNICLNGKNWNGLENCRAIAMQSGTNHLTVTTCQADALDASGKPTNNKIIANGSNSQGFGVWVSSGTFDFYAGNIDGSNFTTTSNGAAVCVSANQTMNMYSAKAAIIGGNTVDNKNGGCMSTAGTFNMYNGVIKNGYTQHYAANLHVSGGVVNMYDGLITGGTGSDADKKWGYNVTITGATFNMAGGQIDGAIGQLGNEDKHNATLVISGDAVINGGTSGYNLKDGDRLTLKVKDLKAEAKIVLDLTSTQTILVEGNLPENWKSIITAAGYTAALNDAGTEITFTANP